MNDVIAFFDGCEASAALQQLAPFFSPGDAGGAQLPHEASAARGWTLQACRLLVKTAFALCKHDEAADRRSNYFWSIVGAAAYPLPPPLRSPRHFSLTPRPFLPH